MTYNNNITTITMTYNDNETTITIKQQTQYHYNNNAYNNNDPATTMSPMKITINLQ
jgi:hypothetical protein